MSFDAVSWAMDQQIGRATAKFLLVALAECVDGKGTDHMVCFPSAAHLARRTEMDRKSVNANLKLLRDAGFIEDTGERKGTTNQVVIYRLKAPENSAISAVPKPDKEAQNSLAIGPILGPLAEEGTGPIFPAKRPNIPTEEAQYSLETGPILGHGTSEEQVIEQVIEQVSKRAKACASLDRPHDVSEQTWADWLQLRKAKRASVTKTVVDGARRESVKAGMSLEDFLQLWCMRGSQGLIAEWIKPAERSKTGVATKQSGFDAAYYEGAENWG